VRRLGRHRGHRHSTGPASGGTPRRAWSCCSLPMVTDTPCAKDGSKPPSPRRPSPLFHLLPPSHRLLLQIRRGECTGSGGPRRIRETGNTGVARRPEGRRSDVRIAAGQWRGARRRTSPARLDVSGTGHRSSARRPACRESMPAAMASWPLPSRASKPPGGT
jgi:hypothetical protein